MGPVYLQEESRISEARKRCSLSRFSKYRCRHVQNVLSISITQCFSGSLSALINRWFHMYLYDSIKFWSFISSDCTVCGSAIPFWCLWIYHYVFPACFRVFSLSFFCYVSFMILELPFRIYSWAVSSLLCSEFVSIFTSLPFGQHTTPYFWNHVTFAFTVDWLIDCV